MRKLVSALTLLIIFASCDKIDDLTKFELDYNQSVTIPSSAGVDLPFDVFTPEMNTNSESQFSVNDTRKDLIEEIKLTDLILVLTAPENADFSFLQSIEVYIKAEGLEETLIAFKREIPENATNTLELETTDTDLQEFIKKDEFFLRLNTVTDELMSSDHEIDVNSTFFVDAKILGL